MKAAREIWRRIAEPTLQLRSVLFVLLAFVLIWGVLLGYMYLRYTRAIAAEPPLRQFAAALAVSLEDVHSPAEAAAAMRATERWVNIRRREGGRFAPLLKIELLDTGGQVVLVPESLREVPAADWAAGAVARISGVAHKLQEVRGTRWTVRLADPVRSTESFLAYNSGVIVEYLLIALPFVLLPVWWSVRSGLRPLARFADGIARRSPGDLQPLAFEVRHREIKPLARSLDALLEQLRQRFERERVFVQDAAHEIRTPLAVIATQAHVLARAPRAEERERAAALLGQAIARASHLAQQLLMLATLDEGRAAACRRVDVAQVLRELLAQLAPQAMARGMELSMEGPDHLWCEVDEPAFNSAIGNLVDNAIRYGREQGTIVVTLRGDAERLSVQVQDDGPGIAAADRERVFERFYRPAGQDSPGSGLGLAIVRQAARRMGGHAVLGAGLQGQGVGFVLSLPVRGFRPA